ncbi:MAG TPA: hypothetical protein VFN57_08485 [Thermomicrobiaceae bacterium]|nr:hypothetical protein [Thermomicrobiaceae bacterium]
MSARSRIPVATATGTMLATMRSRTSTPIAVSPANPAVARGRAA